MPDLKRTRRRLAVIVAVLGLIDTAAVAMLLTPLAGSETSRQQQLRQLWLELKARQSAPWRGLDKKMPVVEREIEDFYRDRFASGYSVISTDLDRVASETGVKMTAEKYSQKDAAIPGLERIEVEADLSGDYLQLVRFINALERSRLFFIIDDVQLGGQQSGIVKLQIKVETYLRAV